MGVLLLGVLLFCYPGYVLISEWIGREEPFPRNASSALTLMAALGMLYGAP